MRLAELEIFREQLTELFPRRSGKSMGMYYWILAFVEVMGTTALEYNLPQDGSRIRIQVDWWAKSRDWAKWFLKEVQRIPLLLTGRLYSYVRSFPSGPLRMEIEKPLSLITIDEFLPVPEEEWEKHILPL